MVTINQTISAVKEKVKQLIKDAQEKKFTYAEPDQTMIDSFENRVNQVHNLDCFSIEHGSLPPKIDARNKSDEPEPALSAPIVLSFPEHSPQSQPTDCTKGEEPVSAPPYKTPKTLPAIVHFPAQDQIEIMAVQPEFEHPRRAYGWAARDTSGVLSPFLFSRRYVRLVVSRLHASPEEIKQHPRACLATMGILYYRLPQRGPGDELPNDE